MPHRLEIALKPDLFDAEGEGIRQKAKHYFDIELASVRSIHVVTIDAALTDAQLETIQKEVFTNPVTQTSSFDPLPIAFDWTI
jgi:phosphoribosylformylglycinamidine synthase